MSLNLTLLKCKQDSKPYFRYENLMKCVYKAPGILVRCLIKVVLPSFFSPWSLCTVVLSRATFLTFKISHMTFKIKGPFERNCESALETGVDFRA